MERRKVKNGVLSAPGSPRMFSSVDTHLPRFEALAYDLPHFDALTHVVILESLAFIFQRFAEVRWGLIFCLRKAFIF